MISGKSFADACIRVVDPRYPNMRPFFNAQAATGDWVFVNGDVIDTIPSKMIAISRKRFVFVVHNSDRPFGSKELGLLLPFAKHIYAINTNVQHPLLTTIPLGFVDHQLEFLEGFKCEPTERSYEIYMNFTSATNAPKRNECVDAFVDDPRVVRTKNLTLEEYYADLCRSKFVLCPEGTGMDTHRVYESLFCGATPVVLRNSLSHLYEKLPVCIVDKWTDPFVVPEQKKIDWSIKAFL